VSEGKGVDVWEELRAGAFLGTDAFVKQLAPLLAEKPPDPEIRKEERFAARPSLEKLFSGISDKAMRNERIHQAVRAYHYKLREVGEFLGLHFSTISVIAKRASEAENQKQRSDPTPPYRPRRGRGIGRSDKPGYHRRSRRHPTTSLGGAFASLRRTTRRGEHLRPESRGERLPP